MSTVAKRRVARRRSNHSASEPPGVRHYNTQSYGLCNQLFIVACALADGMHYRQPVSFSGFYPDMTSARCVGIDQLLDVAETNRNLVDTSILLPAIVKSAGGGGGATMFPRTEWQREHHAACLRALVFCEPILTLANSLAPKNYYYCVHFRLDIDMVLFYRSNIQMYHHWLRLTSQGSAIQARRVASDCVEEHKEWILQRVSLYVDALQRHCADKTLALVVLTAIGKPNIMLGQNDLLEWTYCKLRDTLLQNGWQGAVQRNAAFPSIGREHSAAVELCVACNERCVGFVASGGSTFSETIKARIAPERHLCTI